MTIYTPPTAEEIRAASVMVFAEYDAAAGSDPDPLTQKIAEAVAEFHGTMRLQAETVIDFAQIDVDTTNGATLKVLLDKALRMWVEYTVAASQPENIDASGDLDIHASSGGRTGPSRRSLSAHLHMWHVWPQLDRILRFIVKLYNEDIDPADLPADVPAIQTADALPRPGAWLMDGTERTGYSPFELPLPPGVARVQYGS